LNVSPTQQITPDPNSVHLNLAATASELDFDAVTVITEKKLDPASFGGDTINLNSENIKKPKIQGAFMESSPKKSNLKAQQDIQ
jgi:hypothetical protein